MIGKCKLCGEEKELCNQSHIIPNFMYRDLLDEKNRFYAIQLNESGVHSRGVRQTGEFDKNILCQPCDNGTLGKLDRYASLILYGGNPKIFENRIDPDGIKYTYCADIDYSQFKLFLLSLLWRASISQRRFFAEVNLGPHEERIRQMLINSEPGDQLKYPCLIMTYLHTKKYIEEIVAQPSRARVNGGYVYTFPIGGMVYVFFVSEHIIPGSLKDLSISPKGELKIRHSSPCLSRRIIGSMVGARFVQATKSNARITQGFNMLL
ncbi:hypothetical protein Dalk_3229 [Desulfatibacillum aliphaticivorans]|uniref:HNH endonuclease 5 domain-containing protein n=1 Tax=Desulfatibacillum aliphaticivorans TaxID=218208 RepID=B8FGL0_DESAL|nr:hypothetical protein [Desulfatibacillum aliphaticivorans]ACL04919.1 hypothetical protein Dalk_3229 [Desulfatibacillum aliphaticivorans]